MIPDELKGARLLYIGGMLHVHSGAARLASQLLQTLLHL